jgi:hypothetical protein
MLTPLKGFHCLGSCLISCNYFSQAYSLQQLIFRADQAFAGNGTLSSIVLSEQVDKYIGHERRTAALR